MKRIVEHPLCRHNVGANSVTISMGKEAREEGIEYSFNFLKAGETTTSKRRIEYAEKYRCTSVRTYAHARIVSSIFHALITTDRGFVNFLAMR